MGGVVATSIYIGMLRGKVYELMTFDDYIVYFDMMRRGMIAAMHHNIASSIHTCEES